MFLKYIRLLIACFLTSFAQLAFADTATCIFRGQQYLPDWDQHIDFQPSLFADTRAGDRLRINVKIPYQFSTATPEGQISLFALRSIADDFPILPDCQVDTIRYSEVLMIPLSANMASEIRRNGLVISGVNIVVYDITVIAAERQSNTIWSGNFNFGENYNSWVSIPVSRFRNADVGDILRISAVDVRPNAKGLLQCDKPAGRQYIPEADKWVYFSGNYFQYVITDEMLPVLQGLNGETDIIINGYNFTLKSVEILDPRSIILPQISVDHSLDGLVFEGSNPVLNLSYNYPDSADHQTVIDIKVHDDKGEMVGRCTISSDYPIRTIPLPVGNRESGIFSYQLDVNQDIIESYNFALNTADITSDPDYLPDFFSFWENAKRQLASVNIHARLTLIPEASTAARSVYLVEMLSIPDGDSTEPVTIRGYYAEPNKPGKYPAIIHFKGYDDGTVTPTLILGNDNPGFVEFSLFNRGQWLNNRPPYQNIYGNWFGYGFDSKLNYYYRGAYMDVLRAIDFVQMRHKVQSENIFADGHSQGGAFAIVAAALGDGRINSIACGNPFMGDFPNYFQTALWPASIAFERQKELHISDRDMYEMLSYFDTKNLATLVNCPVYSAISLQDATCPPCTTLAVFNNIQSDDKQLIINPMLNHTTHPQWDSEIKRFYLDHIVHPENGQIGQDRPIDCDDPLTDDNPENVGIQNIFSSDADHTLFFDINGNRLNSTPTAPGIYIRLTNGTPTKLIIH